MKATTGLLLLAAVPLAGCGGGDGSNSPPNTGGGGFTLQSNFQSIQDEVFTPICTNCHLGASAPLGLRLDAANSFGLLVGVTSAQAPPLLRVSPGNPNDSYLIQKLEGTAGTGQQMPIGAPGLPQADIDVIRQWIIDGALRTMPPTGSPIRVTSLSPLPGGTLNALPASVIAMFDRELEATSVDATTFTLERSGGDGTFGDGNEVMVTAAAITVPMANPMTAIFDLAGVASQDDTYRVQLAGTGGATIRDLATNALDGEFSGFFPSGDGIQGGDFEGLFTIAALAPTIESIQANVFSTTCSPACHTGPTGGALPGGMDLSNTDASFNSLVMVPSIQSPTMVRVIPGDPDASYLIQKVEGRAGFGQIMPPPEGGPPLDQALIDILRQWIVNGADR